MRHNSTCVGAHAGKQRVFLRHDTGFASVLALFALGVAVADQAARASAEWVHAVAFRCASG